MTRLGTTRELAMPGISSHIRLGSDMKTRWVRIKFPISKTHKATAAIAAPIHIRVQFIGCLYMI